MITITFLNIKGGVGKTTTSVNIAAGLVDKGKRVLFIDYDKQGDSSDFFPSSSEVTIGDVLLDTIPIEQAMFKAEDNLYIIPSAMDIKDVEVKFNRDEKGARHDVLKKSLDRIQNKFDYCIIDCHPDMNILIANAIYASDKLIITIKPTANGVKGFQNTLDNIEMLKNNLDISIDPYVLFTIVSRINTEKSVMETIRGIIPDKVFDTQIRYQIGPIAKAEDRKELVIRYSIPLIPNVSRDMRNAVDEIIRRFENGKKKHGS